MMSQERPADGGGGALVQAGVSSVAALQQRLRDRERELHQQSQEKDRFLKELQVSMSCRSSQHALQLNVVSYRKEYNTIQL